MVDEAVSPGDVIDVLGPSGHVHRELVVVHRLGQRGAGAQRRQQRQHAP